MGSDESMINQSENSSLPSVSGQILISVHGSVGSGKTTLINQFIQKPFDSEYIPTKQMESRQVLWNSIQQPDKTFRVVIWDVVESTTTSPRPVDTISRADGIVVIYNPNDIYSVEYALSILYKLPINETDEKSKIPVLILSNFLDLRGNRQKIHQRLKNAPYPQIQTSMKTGIGLDICAIWLDRALLYNKQRSLEAQLRSVREEKEELTIAIRLSSEKSENQKMISPKSSQSINKKISTSNSSSNQHRIRMPSLSQLLIVKTEEDNQNNNADNSDNESNSNNNNSSINSNNEDIKANIVTDDKNDIDTKTTDKDSNTSDNNNDKISNKSDSFNEDDGSTNIPEKEDIEETQNVENEENENIKVTTNNNNDK